MSFRFLEASGAFTRARYIGRITCPSARIGRVRHVEVADAQPPHRLRHRRPLGRAGRLDGLQEVQRAGVARRLVGIGRRAAVALHEALGEAARRVRPVPIEGRRQQHARGDVEPRRQHLVEAGGQRDQGLAAARKAELVRLLDQVGPVGAAGGQRHGLRTGTSRLQQLIREIGGVQREGRAADHPPARLLDQRSGVAPQALAEGVVHVEDVPAPQPSAHGGLHHRLGQGVGVEAELEAHRRAGLPRQVGAAAGRDQQDAPARPRQVGHGKGDGRCGAPEDGLHPVLGQPAARDAEADIRLVLVVRGLHAHRPAQHLAAEILDRHLRREDEARPGVVRVGPGHVGEHADPHRRAGGLRPRRRDAASAGAAARRKRRDSMGP